jgi:hypothetical protein
VTTPISGGKRRLDRVLAEDFVSGLASLSLEELRGRREEADQEETDLSYLRRMLQGRLDIVRAEAARRTGSGGSLLDTLPQILADEASGAAPAGLGRHRATEPSRAGETRRREEALVADLGLSDPASLDDDGLRRAADALVAEEAECSAARKRVQAVIDALGAEIARRYKSGEADVEALLPH